MDTTITVLEQVYMYLSMCKDSYTYLHAYIRVDYMCSFIHLYEYKDV